MTKKQKNGELLFANIFYSFPSLNQNSLQIDHGGDESSAVRSKHKGRQARCSPGTRYPQGPSPTAHSAWGRRMEPGLDTAPSAMGWGRVEGSQERGVSESKLLHQNATLRWSPPVTFPGSTPGLGGQLSWSAWAFPDFSMKSLCPLSPGQIGMVGHLSPVAQSSPRPPSHQGPPHIHALPHP